MRFPQQFDENEWFIIVSILVTIIIVLLLPRRFPIIVSVVFFCLGIGIAMYSDFHLGVPPLDLYDINDTEGYELFDLITFIMYSPYAYLFAYFFDKWRVRGLRICLYVFAWAVGATLFEATASFLHLYKYKGWNPGFSFVYYLFAQSSFLLLYCLTKWAYNKTKLETAPEWN